LSQKTIPVSILTNVDKVEVIINGSKKGATENGKIDLQLRPGSYNLELRKNGYEKLTQKIKISENEDNKYNFELVKNQFDLTINCDHNDADIFINDEKVASGTFNGSVAKGKNIIRVEKTVMKLKLKKLTLMNLKL